MGGFGSKSRLTKIMEWQRSGMLMSSFGPRASLLNIDDAECRSGEFYALDLMNYYALSVAIMAVAAAQVVRSTPISGLHSIVLEIQIYLQTSEL